MPLTAVTAQLVKATLRSGRVGQDFAIPLDLQAASAGLRLRPEVVEVDVGLGDNNASRAGGRYCSGSPTRGMIASVSDRQRPDPGLPFAVLAVAGALTLDGLGTADLTFAIVGLRAVEVFFLPGAMPGRAGVSHQ
jgi:hypothetical protein